MFSDWSDTPPIDRASLEASLFIGNKAKELGVKAAAYFLLLGKSN